MPVLMSVCVRKVQCTNKKNNDRKNTPVLRFNISLNWDLYLIGIIYSLQRN